MYRWHLYMTRQSEGRARQYKRVGGAGYGVSYFKYRGYSKAAYSGMLKERRDVF